jgi:hypothetical protein
VGAVAYTTPRNTTKAVEAADGVLANALDADGDALSAEFGPPAHGTVTGAANGSFVYVPDPDYWGPDSFTFNVSDSQGGSTQGVASITVIGECGRSPATGAGPAGPGSRTSDGPLQLSMSYYSGAKDWTAVAPQTRLLKPAVLRFQPDG